MKLSIAPWSRNEILRIDSLAGLGGAESWFDEAEPDLPSRLSDKGESEGAEKPCDVGGGVTGGASPEYEDEGDM
jgi:hypothetical protein